MQNSTRNLGSGSNSGVWRQGYYICCGTVLSQISYSIFIDNICQCYVSVITHPTLIWRNVAVLRSLVCFIYVVEVLL